MNYACLKSCDNNPLHRGHRPSTSQVVFVIAYYVTALGPLHMIVFIVMLIYNCSIPHGLTSVCQYYQKNKKEKKERNPHNKLEPNPQHVLNVSQILDFKFQHITHVI
jgi:hypothetical protein